MLFEKFPYEKPQVIVEFDLVVSAGPSEPLSQGVYPDLDDPLNFESLGLGDPFDLAH